MAGLCPVGAGSAVEASKARPHLHRLARGAELHHIVGNSTFYGTVLPTEQIYEVMLKKLGFADVECRPIRKRNSKKELIEFDVTGRWCR